jgi:release factor glutamine methyltransferase
MLGIPYVPTADCAPAPDPVSFEPLLARDGGPDGLDLYRRLMPDLPRLVAPRGIAILEAGPANAAALDAMVREALPNAGIETIRDYADLERFIIAVIPP